MRTDWRTKFQANGNWYTLRKTYKDEYVVSPLEYAPRNHVSASVYSDVCKAICTSNNIFKPTKAKIDAKVKELEAISVKLAELEAIAEAKVSAFLKEIAPLNPVMAQDGKSGYIVKNGLEFEFSINQDGYISKKISVHYTVPNTLEAFKELTNK